LRIKKINKIKIPEGKQPQIAVNFFLVKIPVSDVLVVLTILLITSARNNGLLLLRF
jgi:hypothetical protein